MSHPPPSGNGQGSYRPPEQRWALVAGKCVSTRRSDRQLIDLLFHRISPDSSDVTGISLGKPARLSQTIPNLIFPPS